MKHVAGELRDSPDPGAHVDPFVSKAAVRETSMIKYFISELRGAVVATLSLAVVVCGVYPLLVWAAAQGLFPYEAGGSLIQRGGKLVGSELIAQNFSSPKYFHPR